MLLGAFRGGSPLERIVGKSWKRLVVRKRPGWAPIGDTLTINAPNTQTTG
jgi:hypothetical protein